jgi:hypothetical protein
MKFLFVCFLLSTFLVACSNNEQVKVPEKKPETKKENTIKAKPKKKSSKKSTKSLSNSEEAINRVEKISEVRNLKRSQDISIFSETEDENSYTVVVEQEGEMTSVELMRFEVKKSGEILAYDLQTGELLPLKTWQESYKSEYGRK